MDQIKFKKMHGLGNDFVVIDSRGDTGRVTPALAQAIGHRHFGVGFDQLAEITESDQADVKLTFYNADGSTAGACGNATRCIAAWHMDQHQISTMALETERGLLAAKDMGNGLTAVNMGAPFLEWRDVPLSDEMDTLNLPIERSPTATGMGNPHCTFFVEDVSQIDLATEGAKFEHHPLFPERTNVQFAQIIGENHIRMRVWERGVGITLASGSSSCATAVAATRRGLCDGPVTIDLDGGRIWIDWQDDGVWMTGPTQYVFDGVFTTSFLETAQ